MLFEKLLLSKDTIDRLSYKAGIEVKDEDALCFAICSLLDMHDGQCVNIKDLTRLLRENGINPITSPPNCGTIQAVKGIRKWRNREMREVLFRGKDKDDGNWYEGYYLQLHDTTYCCMPSDKADEANRLNKENEHHYIVFERMTDWGLPNKHLRAEVDPSTVCQYTGLTDKNGRKIFEGDVLSFTQKGQNANGIVKMVDGCFFAIIEGQRCWLSEGVKRYKGRITSNIFDNPELTGDQP